jgi:[ribosomal protein S18]-alanine N-acetyltransferase
MCEKDLETVLNIESASFSRPWTRSHFLDELQSPFGFPLVAQTPDGCVAGYLCLKILLDEAEILDVAVETALRGQGVGQTLVQAGFELCRSSQVTLVFLEVRVSNLEAIGLYGRLGFRESGRRKHYYENGEDAMLMEYTL